MKNQLTFAHVIGALLDNKIKTYPQHQLVRDLFSLCLSDEASDYGEATEDNITFSRWCNGTKPVPVDILNQYDTLVTDNKGNNTLDYGCCRLAAGVIALKEGKPVDAEKNLLAAENIISTAMNTSCDNYISGNDYLKSVYGYLNNLYARWHKPEKSLEYKEKWLNAKTEQNKNITYRNA